MGFREPIFVGSLSEAQRTLLRGDAPPRPAPTTRDTRGADPERPRRVGDGPAEASTCLALLSSPVVCWDVNGYYRDLGVHWKATRKQLRDAYVARGGPNSERLTYVFKQLLDVAVRREYDRTPLGEVFLDAYVSERVRRQACLRAAAKRARGEVADEEQELSDLGYVIEDEEPEGARDEPSQVVDDRDEEVQSPPGRTQPWRYSHYLWRSAETDTDRLREWQGLLVGALGRRGENIRIAVGYCGRMAHPWVVGTVGFRTVVFLNDREQPTAEMAEAVADRVARDRQELPHREIGA